MKHLHKLLLLLPLVGSLSCESWEVDRLSFPEIHTLELVEKTFTSVKVKGEIRGLAGNLTIIEHGFVWSDSTVIPTIEDRVSPNGARKNSGDFILELTDLTLNTEYHIRAFAELETGIIYEEEALSFTPELLDLNITMDSIKKGINEVVLYGTVEGLQPGVEIISHGHVWSTETNWPTISKDNAVFSGVIAGERVLVESKLEGLEPLKEYHVRTFIISGSRPIYSPTTISFTKGDIWIEKEAFPTGFYPGFFGHNLLVEQDTTVYFYQSPNFGRYYPDDRWEPLDGRDIPDAAAFTIGKKIYLINESSSETWEYDTENPSWDNLTTKGKQFKFPGGQRRGLYGFAVGERGYAGYGIATGVNQLDRSFYEFDPENGWGREIDSFPKTTRSDENILSFQFADRACLGMGKQAVHTDFWCYEPTSKKWQAMPSLPVAAASATFNFRAFTIGEKGFLLLPTKTNNFWEFDNDVKKWTLRADFPGGENSNYHFSSRKKGYIGSWNKHWEYLPESQ